jgi:hypothetical protein
MFSGCVEFKQMKLYDGIQQDPPPVKPEKISSIVEPVIFYDDMTDVWGVEDEICKRASVSTDVVYSGNKAIKISWDRNEKGCIFAGFGIGWDRYAGKDLSEIMDFVAIQLHVRTVQGKMFGLPIVLTLEDYSGGMGFCYTTNKYFERTAIDEDWQKVLVPLSDFDLETENLNPGNIKQLQLELQQSGSVYIDDISLVFYDPVPQEPWMVEESLPNPVNFPIQLFDESFINDNFWGLIKDECQNIKLSDDAASVGGTSIYADWNDNAKCNLVAFGISWNKWRPVDLTPVLNSGAIQFDLRIKSGIETSLPVKIGFEDYDRAKGFVELSDRHVSSGEYNKVWQRVTVPLSEMPENLDMKHIKQLYIEFEGSGKVFFDNIQLVNL